jgi:hypothetical protein
MVNITRLMDAQYKVSEDVDIFKTAEKRALNNSYIRKIARIAWNVLSVIVFPIGLGRLSGMLVRNIARSLILPAQFRFNPKNASISWLDYKREAFINDRTNHAQQVTIETADGVKLDNLVIHNPEQNETPANEQKWVVYFMGNACCYEECLEEMKELSQRTGANVLIGNPRGVFRSEGLATKSKQLILDGEAKVQYLKNLGVDTKNILLHGHSLGGGIATAVAVNHQEEGHEMNLCNDRSFASLQAFLTSMGGKFLGSIVSSLAINGRWEFNSVDNYKKIKGKKFIIHTKDDQVIKYSAGLYKHLKDEAMTAEDRRLKAERVKARLPGQKSVKQPGVRTDYKPENALKMVVTAPNEGFEPKLLNGMEGFAHCIFLLTFKEAVDRFRDRIAPEMEVGQLLNIITSLRGRMRTLGNDYCNQVQRAWEA